MRVRRGQWGGKLPQATLLCVAYSSGLSAAHEGECYTGSARGDILVWRERALVHAVRAHSGPVFAIARAVGEPAAAAGEHEHTELGHCVRAIAKLLSKEDIELTACQPRAVSDESLQQFHNDGCISKTVSDPLISMLIKRKSGPDRGHFLDKSLQLPNQKSINIEIGGRGLATKVHSINS